MSVCSSARLSVISSAAEQTFFYGLLEILRDNLFLGTVHVLLAPRWRSGHPPVTASLSLLASLSPLASPSPLSHSTSSFTLGAQGTSCASPPRRVCTFQWLHDDGLSKPNLVRQPHDCCGDQRISNIVQVFSFQRSQQNGWYTQFLPGEVRVRDNT